ncbi:MAG: DinB family protein, partial [Bacteroidota bacterium]
RWEHEYETTLKLFNAFPGDKLDFKPHERSRTARDLAWTIVSEEPILINGGITGKFEFEKMPKPPASMKEVLSAYAANHKELVQKVKNLSEGDYNKQVKFMVGPNKFADFRCADICWMAVFDTIHHRGQFSVYLRMTGGKVPSIYGPSGDEPWM